MGRGHQTDRQTDIAQWADLVKIYIQFIFIEMFEMKMPRKKMPRKNSELLGPYRRGGGGG